MASKQSSVPASDRKFLTRMDEQLARQKYKAIVIGASAGGIKALLQLLGGLPLKIAVPVIIVIHMPDNYESQLANVFQHHVAAKVMTAEDKRKIDAGCIYFAGPSYHLSIERDFSFSVSCEDPVHFSRPSIDFLMSSAADAYGASLAGILLTGANEDGAAGMLAIHNAGGLTIVQDPADAEIAVMPQAALNLFIPDFVLPLSAIRQLLLTLENC